MSPVIQGAEVRNSPSLTTIVEATAAREIQLSRLLVAYISLGLLFMLLPGTFLGVWNLLAISSHHSAGTVPAAWIQAHGHAQIFGWIGSFILGIGYYSIPKLRRLNPFALWTPWTSLLLWSTGVTLRWVAGVYGWQWRILLPLSALLEISAFLLFFRVVSGHSAGDTDGKRKLETWILVVIAGSLGWMATLILNLFSAALLAWRGSGPVLPHSFDQRFLVLQTWGFLVPFIWGFSAKWLPIFLGLRPLHSRRLIWAVALNSTGVIAALLDWFTVSAIILLAGFAVAAHSLRVFEAGERPPKIKGVHCTFPFFIRLAYVWGLISSALAVWAALTAEAVGIWGASRHALTVGFIALMVFCVGQRVLPAFSGMRLLFSTKLMFAATALLALGCFLRVAAEILAYQGFSQHAWSCLPVSAITELTAVTIFGVNLALTFASRKNRAELQYRNAQAA